MLTNLLRIAFGERRNSNSSNQVLDDTPDAKEKAIVKEYPNPDLNILAEKYGELVPGKVIEIELHEAAKLLNRQRIKVDAFDRLKKELSENYDVKLIITSRRTKK